MLCDTKIRDSLPIALSFLHSEERKTLDPRAMNTSRLFAGRLARRSALDDVARTVPPRCPPPLSPSSPSCRCVSGPARQVARAAARSPRAPRRFPDATRTSRLVASAHHSPRFLLPPAVVPAGDAPVRVPGQHLHEEGRRRAREGGPHRAEYVQRHRLDTRRGATGAPAFPL